VYKQILIDAKLQIGKRGQKTELTRRSPLGRQRAELDCGAIDEEEEDDDDEGEEEEKKKKKKKKYACFGTG
jgi:hypothetical protein